MTDSIVYLNGNFIPMNEAHVPVMDRGFIFGDGVYEVIPVFGGRLFRLSHHLQRLNNSLAAIRLQNPLTDDEWQLALDKLVQQNGDADQSVYLQVTRGVAHRDHSFPPDTEPTVFAMSSHMKPVEPSLLAQGVAAITLDDIRWQYCNIKSIALLPNILLRQQAVDAGATEAILLRDGEVTEGAASNIFIVTNNTIVTPPKSDCLLPGITRDLVVELAHTNSMACEERAISEAELLTADEIWMTSSTKEILPITNLNDKPVADGKPGPLWKRIYDIYQAYKVTLRNAG